MRVLVCLSNVFLWLAVVAEQEANESHWSFVAPRTPSLPEVINVDWPEQPIDRFILRALEGRGLTPSVRADKATRLRRVWLSLLGIPPSPEVLDMFLSSPDPRAYEAMVDTLLASYHYGERWGRHWLDVARYGDSNGGDENHAYPYSFRYRNWVIEAFNRDLPFDEFLKEQLAGDLLAESKPASLIGTGFLAIGTKILAEQDPVKKQADIVNEQVDTIGRVFLGLSIGCARCHDHKFDPISQADYYAMAGILHSTAIEDRELLSEEGLASESEWQERIATTKEAIAKFEVLLSGLTDEAASLDWEAEAFDRGNVIVDFKKYGPEIGIISDPGSQENFVEYDIDLEKPGLFSLELRYAAAEARPGRILLDGSVVFPNALSLATGGWMPENQRWIAEGTLNLSAGRHVIRVESAPMMSHIDRGRLVAFRDATRAQAILSRQKSLKKALAELEANRPQHDKVMAVSDGKVRDVPLNVRGNPHAEGEIIPRGVLNAIGAPAGRRIDESSSGRLELAEWMGANDHPLTARVIVNRVWHWHFGRGLVETPDNFGTTGQVPTHPELLDWLALDFVQHDWSIKHLHRRILLSSVYQLSATDTYPRAERLDPDNEWYWRHHVRRMDAETFRDALLALSGRLNMNEYTGEPVPVTYQDPSPIALAENRKLYESFPHRTVYLPVVRSHLYDLLTLLDFPNSTMPTGRRSQTTVPPQALLMFNSPFVNELAEEVSERLMASKGSVETRLSELFKNLYARYPSEKEEQTCLTFFAQTGEGSNSKEAWTTLCHTLMIANEFLYVW